MIGGFRSSVREIVFGLEDSLVSTLGTVTGIAVGVGETSIVILSGVVLMAVESLSMAAGSYLSTKADIEVNRTSKRTTQRAATSAGYMWVFYAVGGIVPLAPYFFLSVTAAILPSVLLSIVALGFLGIFTAKLSGRPILVSALEMIAVSMAAAALGFSIGHLLGGVLGITV
ncbi:MAG: VIT1/CCC1 transporter family protein [bacterium]|nr:VIT1/CCC1 transporter family protein [bacterium]